MRHADELSITVQPRFAASGARSLLVPPPALNRAMSTPSNASGVASSTVRSPQPGTATVLPAERSDASRRSSVIGNSLLEQHLDHGAADGAGGADDGDGELLGAGSGHGPTF